MKRAARTILEERQALIAVVHLPPSLGYPACPGLAAASAGLARDLRILVAGGVDGVLLENDNDKPHTLEVSKAQVAWLTRLAALARCEVPLLVGIGVQRIDWRAALAIAAACDLDFVRLDVFVDRVTMIGQEVAVDPAAVRELRGRLGAEGVALFTDVHVKHATLKSAASLAESASRAAEEGSDAVLITGERTGEPPSRADLEAAKRSSTAPVLIGSGLTAENAPALARSAHGALVGTALKRGDRVDAERVEQVVRAWREACGSRR